MHILWWSGPSHQRVPKTGAATAPATRCHHEQQTRRRTQRFLDFWSSKKFYVIWTITALLRNISAPPCMCVLFYAPSHRKPAFAAVISKFVDQPGIHETIAGVPKKAGHILSFSMMPGFGNSCWIRPSGAMYKSQLPFPFSFLPLLLGRRFPLWFRYVKEQKKKEKRTQVNALVIMNSREDEPEAIERSHRGYQEVERFLSQCQLKSYLPVFIKEGFDSLSAVDIVSKIPKRRNVLLACLVCGWYQCLFWSRLFLLFLVSILGFYLGVRNYRRGHDCHGCETRSQEGKYSSIMFLEKF